MKREVQRPKTCRTVLRLRLGVFLGITRDLLGRTWVQLGGRLRICRELP